jgi:hypothetical protein
MRSPGGPELLGIQSTGAGLAPKIRLSVWSLWQNASWQRLRDRDDLRGNSRVFSWARRVLPLGAMNTADEYRKQAEECRQLAASAIKPVDKAFRLRLAEDW